MKKLLFLILLSFTQKNIQASMHNQEDTTSQPTHIDSQLDEEHNLIWIFDQELLSEPSQGNQTPHNSQNHFIYPLHQITPEGTERSQTIAYDAPAIVSQESSEELTAFVQQGNQLQRTRRIGQPAIITQEIPEA